MTVRDAGTGAFQDGRPVAPVLVGARRQLLADDGTPLYGNELVQPLAGFRRTAGAVGTRRRPRAGAGACSSASHPRHPRWVTPSPPARATNRVRRVRSSPPYGRVVRARVDQLEQLGRAGQRAGVARRAVVLGQRVQREGLAVSHLAARRRHVCRSRRLPTHSRRAADPTSDSPGTGTRAPRHRASRSPGSRPARAARTATACAPASRSSSSRPAWVCHSRRTRCGSRHACGRSRVDTRSARRLRQDSSATTGAWRAGSRWHPALVGSSGWIPARAEGARERARVVGRGTREIYRSGGVGALFLTARGKTHMRMAGARRSPVDFRRISGLPRGSHRHTHCD